MKYSELNLKTPDEYNICSFNDKEIKVLKYLPIKDKIDLIEIALERAQENGRYNEMKLDIYFNLYLIYMYTDLEFTDEEKANDEELYDELISSGLLADIINAIDEEEYDELVDYLVETKEKNEEFMTSAAALLRSFIQDLPKNAQAAAEIVENFDKDKYKEVVQFARDANGGRPI